MWADGYCNPHYKRKWRHGDPLAGAAFMDEDPKQRLARLYQVDEETGCWLWTGAVDWVGYGEVWWKGKRHRAHRAVFDAYRGAMPSELDHLCKTKRCVNPDHLEPVSRAENMRRLYATITACPKGHEYVPENIYMDHGKRRCRECMRNQQRARRARAKD